VAWNGRGQRIKNQWKELQPQLWWGSRWVLVLWDILLKDWFDWLLFWFVIIRGNQLIKYTLTWLSRVPKHHLVYANQYDGEHSIRWLVVRHVDDADRSRNWEPMSATRYNSRARYWSAVPDRQRSSNKNKTKLDLLWNLVACSLLYIPSFTLFNLIILQLSPVCMVTWLQTEVNTIYLCMYVFNGTLTNISLYSFRYVKASCCTTFTIVIFVL